MEAISLFEKDFEYDSLKKYLLVLQTGNKAITYAVFDIAANKYVGLKHVPFDTVPDIQIIEFIKKSLEEDRLLSFKFSEVVYQHLSFRAMLVPESLFDSKNLRAFLRFHYDVDEKDYIHFQELKPAEAFVIFTVPVLIEDLLCHKYPQVKFSHHTIPFIHNAIDGSDKNDNSPGLHIYFANDFFDIMIVRNNKIQLFNSFFYKKYTDVLFFIANILNLFSLTPGSTKIHILGEVNDASELKAELKKIFKVINFEKFNPDFEYNSGLPLLEQHRFANLLNLYPCEL
jgi:hypothetical protein